jgi:hypothetical protein
MLQIVEKVDLLSESYFFWGKRFTEGREKNSGGYYFCTHRIQDQALLRGYRLDLVSNSAGSIEIGSVML